MSLQVEKLTLQDVVKVHPCMRGLPSQFSEWKSFVSKSREWMRNNLGVHVEGYHLIDNKDEVIGHIYYAPSEKALVSLSMESNLAFIYCIYLKEKCRGKGHGKKFLSIFKEEMRKQGFKGIIVKATEFPQYMHYAHFERQGFKAIEQHGSLKIMYFPLTKDTVKVTMRKLNYKPLKEKVEITLFKNYLCPFMVNLHNKAKKVAATLGDKLEVVEVEATLENLEKYGVADGILINGKRKLMGLSSSEENIRAVIEEEIEW